MASGFIKIKPRYDKFVSVTEQLLLGSCELDTSVVVEAVIKIRRSVENYCR